MFLKPENFTLTGNPFLSTGAYLSGIFTSAKIIELSSKVIIIEFSEPNTFSVIPLNPSFPLKGAKIVSSFNLTIISPFFT